MSRFTDLKKVSKIYKLRDGKKASGEPKGKRDAVEDEHEKGQVEDRKELEIIVLGLMALRGQS